MYPQYFGLREPSFALTPDPRYVFLTEQHREALAHLLYGAGDPGGFVLLTGDIGTGKTTICRAFLDQLPSDIDVALVLNPALTAIELLAAICDEFGVTVPTVSAHATKNYLDVLNQFLLACHAAGRRPVVLIDEAQNLSPHVLEQVRLLTNLETATHKLLHIFLIGQPELRTILAAPALRQLNQRITARFHLTPLRAPDTIAYIRHRLAIAGIERPLFTRRAMRIIHRQSGGVPRLINLICDRALLGAAVGHHAYVTAAIAHQAAREIHGQSMSPPRRRRWLRTSMIILGSVAVLLTAVGGGIWLGTTGQITLLPILLPPVSARPVPPATITPAVPVATTTPLSPRLSQVPPATVPDVAAADVATLTTPDVSAALVTLLHYWGSAPPATPPTQCAQVEKLPLGLGCERGQRGRFNTLRQFDHPALITLTLTTGTTAYAVLIGLDDEYAVLAQRDVQRRVPIAVLDERWSGEYLWLWRLPPVGVKVIGRAAPPAAVQWLRHQLAPWPASGLSVTPTMTAGAEQYDETLIAAVRRFQTAHGLIADGIAGPRTLMLLMMR